jgi:DNA-binding NarL/FixJ family response regulator
MVLPMRKTVEQRTGAIVASALRKTKTSRRTELAALAIHEGLVRSGTIGPDPGSR